MIGRNGFQERRGSSFIKPLIFLLIEAGGLALVCWLVHLFFHIVLITVFASFGAIYFFMISSLPRYWRVLKRQKYYKH
ncbi:MAG: hypothetical protein IE885_01265 [Campylobacterales bacterium]|nr:hypothetical protein [Campylobacterales bacterium]